MTNKAPVPFAAIIGGAVGGFVLLAFAITLVACCIMRQRRKSAAETKSSSGQLLTASQVSSATVGSATVSSAVLPSTASAAASGATTGPWGAPVVRYNELQFERKLGSGAFGEVWLATYMPHTCTVTCSDVNTHTHIHRTKNTCI